MTMLEEADIVEPKTEIMDSSLFPEQWSIMVLKSTKFEIKVDQKGEDAGTQIRLDKKHFLGKGTTSIVLKIDDDKVAKIITNKDYIDDPDGFSKEANLLRKIQHPNISRVIGVGVAYPNNEKYKTEQYEVPCLITEYLPTSLEEKIKNKELGEEKIKEIFKAICSAISYIYEQTGEVVIDLEPAQIRFKEDGTPILNDLGYTANEKEGSVKNWSDFYSDPEVSILKKATLRHTVYSLSLILWQCYTGKDIVRSSIDNKDNLIPAQIFQLIELGLNRNPSSKIETPLEFYKKLVSAYEISKEQNNESDVRV